MAAVVMMILVGCGDGGSNFDADAVRSVAAELAPNADADALVEVVRDVCEDDEQTRRFALAINDAEDGPTMRAYMEAGCPDRIPD